MSAQRLEPSAVCGGTESFIGGGNTRRKRSRLWRKSNGIEQMELKIACGIVSVQKWRMSCVAFSKCKSCHPP